MGDLHSVWFQVHPTTDSPPHQSGFVPGNHIFSTNYVGIEGLALGGDRCRLACSHWFKVNLWKEAIVFGGPIILMMTIILVSFQITLTLRPTRRWSDTLIYAGGNMGVIFLYFTPTHLEHFHPVVIYSLFLPIMTQVYIIHSICCALTNRFNTQILVNSGNPKTWTLQIHKS